MDLLNNAFDEALRTNYNETVKWSQYKHEYEELIKNLKYYQKYNEVPIMLPLGSKALIPAYLYHTNEILVNHYCDYFSKCTTEKSIEICQFRIKLANDNLEKLKTEEELYRNKQDLPLKEQAFFGGESVGQEIIEPYDEEKEKQWRIEHKKKVYEEKQREKQRKNQEKSEETNIESVLNELEMIEELESELDKLEIDKNNELLLNKIVCGEIPLPKEKKRISNYVSKELNKNLSQECNVEVDKAKVVNNTDYNSLCVEDDDNEDDDDCEEEDNELNNFILSPENTNSFKQLLFNTKTLQRKEKLKIFENEYKNLAISILEKNLTNPYIQLRSKNLITAILINEEIYKLKEEINNLNLGKCKTINSNDGASPNDLNKKVKFSEKIETKIINRENDVKLVHHINKVIKNNLKYKLDEHFLDDNIIQIKIKHSENTYAKASTTAGADNLIIETPGDIYNHYIKNKIKFKKEIKSILKDTNYNGSDYIINQELTDNDSDDVIVECFDDEDECDDHIVKNDVTPTTVVNKMEFHEIIGDVVERCDKTSNVNTLNNKVTDTVAISNNASEAPNVPANETVVIVDRPDNDNDDTKSNSTTKKVSLFKKSRIL